MIAESVGAVHTHTHTQGNLKNEKNKYRGILYLYYFDMQK